MRATEFKYGSSCTPNDEICSTPNRKNGWDALGLISYLYSPRRVPYFVFCDKVVLILLFLYLRNSVL